MQRVASIKQLRMRDCISTPFPELFMNSTPIALNVQIGLVRASGEVIQAIVGNGDTEWLVLHVDREGEAL
jgi:hypothetical protein